MKLPTAELRGITIEIKRKNKTLDKNIKIKNRGNTPLSIYLI